MKRLFVLAMATALLLGLSSSAHAVDAPVATGDMEVQMWPRRASTLGAETGQILMIVGVTLPDSTPLPATVRLPIVKGTQVTWAGEIGTSTASADITAMPKVKQGKGGQYAEFRVTKSRRAQIELGGHEYEEIGTKISGKVVFVQTAPAPVTGFALRIPATASHLKIDPRPAGEPSRNTAGESLYKLQSRELKPGQKATIEFSFDTALPKARAPLDATSWIVIIFASLIGIVVVTIAIIMVMRRRGEPGVPDDEAFDARRPGRRR